MFRGEAGVPEGVVPLARAGSVASRAKRLQATSSASSSRSLEEAASPHRMDVRDLAASVEQLRRSLNSEREARLALEREVREVSTGEWKPSRLQADRGTKTVDLSLRAAVSELHRSLHAQTQELRGLSSVVAELQDPGRLLGRWSAEYELLVQSNLERHALELKATIDEDRLLGRWGAEVESHVKSSLERHALELETLVREEAQREVARLTGLVGDFREDLASDRILILQEVQEALDKNELQWQKTHAKLTEENNALRDTVGLLNEQVAFLLEGDASLQQPSGQVHEPKKERAISFATSARAISFLNARPKGAAGSKEPLDVFQTLQNLTYFSDLSSAELTDLAAATTRVTKSVGELFITEGDESAELFVLESGMLEATIEGVGIVHTFHCGEFFGEACFDQGGVRAASVGVPEHGAADTTATCLQIVIGDLSKMLRHRLQLLVHSHHRDYRLDAAVFNRLVSDGSGLLEAEEFLEIVPQLRSGIVKDSKDDAALDELVKLAQDEDGLLLEDFVGWWARNKISRDSIFRLVVEEIKADRESKVYIAQQLVHRHADVSESVRAAPA